MPTHIFSGWPGVTAALLATALPAVPALAVTEAGVWMYALRSRRGLFTAKARSYLGVLRELPALLRSRKRAQAARRRPDRALLDVMDTILPHAPDYPAGPAIRGVDAFFSGYARMLRFLVRW